MLRRFALAVLLVACSSRDRDVPRTVAEGFNEPGLRLAICATVAAFTPPSPAGDGVLLLDAGAWRITTSARLRGTELLVEGSRICLYATLDTDKRIVEADVAAARDGDPWARLPP